MEHHLVAKNLQDSYQSAYRILHFTETALLKVHHDIVTALDSNSCAALLMLDLSEAFDVFDHSMLVYPGLNGYQAKRDLGHNSS